MEEHNNSSNDFYFYNINTLVNLIKNNNELLSNICRGNIFNVTRSNYVLNEDNIMIIINQILSSNNRLCDTIINMMNNNDASNNNYENNYNTYFSNRNRNRNRRESIRERNLTFGNNRIYIDNVPYIIDNIERYSINTARNNRDRTSQSYNYLRNFFEPIDIYPTQSQIESATRIVEYGAIIRPLNTSCPISLERFNDSDRVTVIRYCGHIFNCNELNNWFRTNCRCPVCRYDIRNYNQNENINNLNLTNQNETATTDTSSTSSTNSTNSTNSINTTIPTIPSIPISPINTRNLNNPNNLSDNNSNVERNSNSNLIRQMLNIVNEIEPNILNNTDHNRFGEILYNIATDPSGNNTFNTLNLLWDTYRNIN